MTDPLTTTLAITVGITFYYGMPFEGEYLACGPVYDCQQTEPWGAFPLEWFQDGRFQ